MPHPQKRVQTLGPIGLGAVCAVCHAAIASAGGPVQLQKMFPEPEATQTTALQAGAPIAVEGDVMAVGSGFYDGVGVDSGGVFIFERDENGVWAQHSIVTPADAAAGDFFGQLALKGDTMVVGASEKESPEGRVRAGKAYVFERDKSGEWIQTAELLPTDAVDNLAESQGIGFGTGVAFDGVTIAIGAPGEDDVQANFGAVFLFQRDMNGDWVQMEKLQAAVNNGGFGGGQLAIDGDVVVAGGPGASTTAGFQSGAAFIFERDEMGNWDFELLIPNISYIFGAYGSSVAVSGDTVVIGAINLASALGINDDPGTAWFYQRNKGTGAWDLIQTTMDSEADGGDFYGAVVKINGDTAAIGSLGGHGAQPNAGAAFIMHRDSKTGLWAETERLTADDGQTGDQFAVIAVDGDTVAVGALGAANPDDPGAVGAVYIFDLDSASPSADLDGDGLVGSSDLAILLGSWGPCPAEPAPCPADLDGDGSVGSSDLSILLGGWGLVD